MVTLKPSYRSYVRKCIGNSDFMQNVLSVFMSRFGTEFKFVDCGLEYDSKNVCHLHVVLVTKRYFCEYRENGISINDVINFMKGIYVDFRIFPKEDLDNVIEYINKGTKTNEILDFYRNNYGFI